MRHTITYICLLNNLLSGCRYCQRPYTTIESTVFGTTYTQLTFHYYVTHCKQAPFFPCLLTVGRESRDRSYEELHFHTSLFEHFSSCMCPSCSRSQQLVYLPLQRRISLRLQRTSCSSLALLLLFSCSAPSLLLFCSCSSLYRLLVVLLI